MDEDMINLMAMDLWVKTYVAWEIGSGAQIAAKQADHAVKEFRQRFKPAE